MPVRASVALRFSRPTFCGLPLPPAPSPVALGSRQPRAEGAGAMAYTLDDISELIRSDLVLAAEDTDE